MMKINVKNADFADVGNISFCRIWTIVGTKPSVVPKHGHFRKYIRNNLESFEMSLWRRMGKISWADRVSSEEVLHIHQRGEKYSTYNKRRRDTRIGCILRRNCLLKYFVEGRMEG
jgi:hypothetical protein